jgi:hypothetical protein
MKAASPRWPGSNDASQPAGPGPTRTDSEYGGAVKAAPGASRPTAGGSSRSGRPVGPSAFQWYCAGPYWVSSVVPENETGV